MTESRKRAHATDRRQQVIDPTEKAAVLIDRAYASYHEAVVTAVTGFSDDENAVLARCLDTVTAALSAGEPSVETSDRAPAGV